MNIMDRGYQTTVPPINHKVMEVSNVAFFPAYPLMAGALQTVLDLDPANALLFVAQAAAFGFWCYFFLFCERWKLPTSVRWLRRPHHRGASGGVFSRGRLFRIPLPDGA